jgi:SAM-dependent methyltransferase
MDEIFDEIRTFWDADAPTYDNSRGHHPTNPAVMAAWASALEHLLGPPPVRVLDVGAGTGFLSLVAARLGHRVTSLDISTEMLGNLEKAAGDEGLEIDVVVGNAARTPKGFEAVIERHVLWTLPDPQAALEAWRESVTDGRLVLVESLWGNVDPIESLRNSARHALKQLRGDPPDHHTSYSHSLRESLPLSGGTSPTRLVEMLLEAGWRSPRLERLRDVEWAESTDLPLPDRLLGVSPKFAVVAQ